MFDVTEWLEKHAYGYENLSGKERQAIAGFSILWSLFEAQALGEVSKRPEDRRKMQRPMRAPHRKRARGLFLRFPSVLSKAIY